MIEIFSALAKVTDSRFALFCAKSIVVAVTGYPFIAEGTSSVVLSSSIPARYTSSVSS